MTDHEKSFLTKLLALANMTQHFTLTKDLIEIYINHLSPLGFEKLSSALDVIIADRSSRDAFPSIKEIRAIIKPVVDERSEAVFISNRIWSAIDRFGWSNHREAKLFLGELGWTVVLEAGGWGVVCSDANSSEPTAMKAQLRELALSTISRVKAGRLDVLPKLSDYSEKLNLPIDISSKNMIEVKNK